MHVPTFGNGNPVVLEYYRKPLNLHVVFALQPVGDVCEVVVAWSGVTNTLSRGMQTSLVVLALYQYER
jgi:hypothetical protein